MNNANYLEKKMMMIAGKKYSMVETHITSHHITFASIKRGNRKEIHEKLWLCHHTNVHNIFRPNESQKFHFYCFKCEGVIHSAGQILTSMILKTEKYTVYQFHSQIECILFSQSHRNFPWHGIMRTVCHAHCTPK